MVSKESPPSYNELYVPEMYLGKTDHSSSSSDVSMDGLSQADENSSSSEPLSDILMCQDEFYIHPSHRKVGEKINNVFFIFDFMVLYEVLVTLFFA